MLEPQQLRAPGKKPADHPSGRSVTHAARASAPRRELLGKYACSSGGPPSQYSMQGTPFSQATPVPGMGQLSTAFEAARLAAEQQGGAAAAAAEATPVLQERTPERGGAVGGWQADPTGGHFGQRGGPASMQGSLLRVTGLQFLCRQCHASLHGPLGILLWLNSEPALPARPPLQCTMRSPRLPRSWPPSPSSWTSTASASLTLWHQRSGCWHQWRSSLVGAAVQPAEGCRSTLGWPQWRARAGRSPRWLRQQPPPAARHSSSSMAVRAPPAWGRWALGIWKMRRRPPCSCTPRCAAAAAGVKPPVPAGVIERPAGRQAMAALLPAAMPGTVLAAGGLAESVHAHHSPLARRLPPSGHIKSPLPPGP